MLTINNISIGYGDRTLIANASASIAKGRLVALLGRNGAGKSSLLRVLAGIDKPLFGSVCVAGDEVAAMTANLKARKVAFVTTQRVRIANLRCRDVVAMGRAPYTDWIGSLSPNDSEIVDQSLSLVGMQDYAGRTMDKMSDGECQRIMIARALAQDTPIILLDEPTSFLDLPNRYEVGILLQKLAHEKEKTVVFSTHELDIATSLCDDIALINPPSLSLDTAKATVDSGILSKIFSIPKL